MTTLPIIHACDLEYVAGQYKEWRDEEIAAEKAAKDMGIEDPGYPEWYDQYPEQEYDFTLGRITTKESAICEHARKAEFIDVYTGSEGPHYDPYSYTEVTVDIDNHRYVIHTGLTVWIETDNNGRVPYYGEKDYKDAAEEFERLTGMHPSDWESYWQARVYFDDPMGSLRDYE